MHAMYQDYLKNLDAEIKDKDKAKIFQPSLLEDYWHFVTTLLY